MMKILTSLSLVMFTGLIFAQNDTMPEDYYYEKQEVTVEAFHGLEISGQLKVKLDMQTGNRVFLEGKKEHFEKVIIENRAGILHVKQKPKTKNLKVTVLVDIAKMEHLGVSGLAEVSSDILLPAPKLNLDVSGASNLSIGIDGGKVDADISGASECTIDGEIETLDLDISGAAQLKSAQLKVGSANIEASGASKVDIHVNKELEIEASGASQIIYGGTPTLKDIDISGASKVSAAK